MPALGEKVDVIVLGGGLFGRALAFHLSRRGVGVRVLDRGAPGEGASGRSGGVLTYQGWNPWDVRLVRESALEYQQLSERRGKGAYRENGGIRVVRTPEGVQWLERVEQVLQREGLPFERWNDVETESRLPDGDFADVSLALFTPQDATLDSEALGSAYADLASEEGAEFQWEVGAPTVSRAGEVWRVASRGGLVEAPRLVFACGAWTKGMLRALGCPLPLAPFRAQACQLRPAPLAAPFPTLHDEYRELYVRPAGPGRVLVGDGTGPSEVDPERSNPEADADFPPTVLARLGTLFPGWAPARVERAWAGTCVASPDAFPLVGRVPGLPGLFVGTGFNGFGAMRAAALASRLARGVLEGSWDALRPADPARFPVDAPPFEPRPSFSLPDRATSDEAPSVSEPATPAVPAGISIPPFIVRSVTDPAELDRVGLGSLSDWFDPFLPTFLRDALRCGGSVKLAEVDGRVCGAFLFNPTERTGSIFTRSRPVAERFLQESPNGEVYSEQPLRPGGVPVHVMMADLRDGTSDRTLRHAVRMAVPADLPSLVRFVREVEGPVDQAWFETLPRPDEVCFLCEMDGKIVGMSWLTVVGPYARGHSFVVHPRFRGLGIGTDLLLARMLWLKMRGARQVVSEIYGGNQRSTTAARNAGMALVGQMYAYRVGPPASGGRAAPPRSLGPRTSDRPSP